MTDDALDRAIARHDRADVRQGLRVHTAVFVAVNIFLALVWALTSDGFTVIPWNLFVLGGWGIGLVAHWVVARGRPLP
jgi:hypothetical protein